MVPMRQSGRGSSGGSGGGGPPASSGAALLWVVELCHRQFGCFFEGYRAKSLPESSSVEQRQFFFCGFAYDHEQAFGDYPCFIWAHSGVESGAHAIRYGAYVSEALASNLVSGEDFL